MRLLHGDESLTDDQLVELYPHKPGLRVNFVTSVDGAVAIDGSSRRLSGPADQRILRLLRMLCDDLLVGAGTLRQEDYPAIRLDEARRAWRRARGLPAYPRLAVVSGRLDLDPAMRALAEAPMRPLILTHAGAPQDRRRALARVAEVLTCGDDTIDWPMALGHLAGRAVLCEGGPALMGALTAADVIDELCLTVSAVLAGPGAGRITAGAPVMPRELRLVHALEADGMLLLRYARDRQSGM